MKYLITIDEETLQLIKKEDFKLEELSNVAELVINENGNIIKNRSNCFQILNLNENGTTEEEYRQSLEDL